MNQFTLLLFDIIKKRKTSFFLREFQEAKKLSREEIQNYQFRKLKKLLMHAEKNVPFYRKRFKNNGFSAKTFSSFDQIADITPLTRKDLQEHQREIVALNFDLNKLSKGSSSGSSGVPVTYYKDTMATSAGQAANILGWALSGWKINMKGLHIWGNPSTVNNEWRKSGSKIKALLFGHHKYPAYKLTDGAEFHKLYEIMRKNKFDYIDGYTNAIYLFADYLDKNELHLNYPIKYVLPTAENLQDFQRKKIRQVLGPTYDTYGCSEINGIAYECGNCNLYHVIDPHVYVEFGNEVDDFGSRELLITDLDNYAFPLIRYKNDDLGIPGEDAAGDCDLAFTRLRKISGRQSDIIRFQSGGVLSVPSFFGSMLLKKISGIKQYQVEKIRNNFIYVNLVKTSEFKVEDLEIVSASLKEYLGDKIGYEIRFMDRIAPVASGKFKLVVDRTKKR